MTATRALRPASLPAQNLSGSDRRLIEAALYGLLPVDEHMFDSARTTCGLLAFGCWVSDQSGVEHDDVGRLVRHKYTAIANAKAVGAGASHTMDGVFQIEQTALTHERTQDARKGSERGEIGVPAETPFQLDTQPRSGDTAPVGRGK